MESDLDAPYKSNYRLNASWVLEEGVSLIDSGDASKVTGTVDAVGSERVDGSGVDIGACEYQPAASALFGEAFADLDFDVGL